VMVLPPDCDLSWCKTAVPSHALWTSIHTFLLDKMDIPQSKQTEVKVIYQLGKAKGPRFELQDGNDWVELRRELREYLEDKRKRVKKKLPLFIQAVVVSGQMIIPQINQCALSTYSSRKRRKARIRKEEGRNSVTRVMGLMPPQILELTMITTPL
jgi:hypothetical protein